MGDLQEAPTLFPTLLGTDELKSTLTEKFRSISNLRRLTEAQLVSIYNSMILPLPQRLYSSNYRGRRLKDRRLKRGLEDKQATSKISTTANTVSQFPVRRTSGGDRLKPPPTASSTTTIKVVTQSSPSSTKASPLRRESSEADPARKGSKRNDPPGDTPNCGENETPKKRKIEKITWP